MLVAIKAKSFGQQEQILDPVNNYLTFELSVIDEGVGIPEESIEKLFLDFSRLSETESINRSGTGLGLSICKKIIESMGGSVNVQSKVG